MSCMHARVRVCVCGRLRGIQILPGEFSHSLSDCGGGECFMGGLSRLAPGAGMGLGVRLSIAP